jgi:hypothetical protein
MNGLLHFIAGVLGFVGSIFLPPILALIFWHHVLEGHRKWMAHVIFVPCIIGAVWCFDRLIFWAAHDDGSGPPGLGLLLIFPMLTQVITVTVYYMCVAFKMLQWVWQRINDS